MGYFKTGESSGEFCEVSKKKKKKEGKKKGKGLVLDQVL
jgi:hypothetical protein